LTGGDVERTPLVVEPFAFADYYGQVDRRLLPAHLDVEAAIDRLVDPGASRVTLHWGRNYLYAVDLDSAAGPLAVVVKQFRNEGLKARLRRRRLGSKAERSWRTALRLVTTGVDTPRPVAWIESARPEGASFFVTLKMEAFFESRYLFRAVLSGLREETYEGANVEATFRAMGALIRRMHAAGVWHRDVSIGNLLVTLPEGDPKQPRVTIIDLGRSKLDARLDGLRRMRDLCRLPVLVAAHRRAFLGAYWGRPQGPTVLQELNFTLFARGFLLKNRLKALLRAPFKLVPRLFTSRRAYPHIPPAPEGAAVRDKAVWDHLSDQPHQHAGRLERLQIRLRDSTAHGKTTLAGLGSLPGVVRRERRIQGELYTRPVPFGDVGVAVQPRPEGDVEQLAMLEELGARHVLLRLYPWEEDQEAAEALAESLVARGSELVIVLAQNRELVSDPARWRAAVEALGSRFRPYARHFQIGQAVNRSKWGVWNPREYLDLAEPACEVLSALDDVVLLGPPLIDFELHAYLGLLARERDGVQFDALAAQLYVDRRGAPENRQLGYDTVGKVVAIKAIVERSKLCDDRMWITEFNWPLWEGPHSPAGRDASVDEEQQADFLVRYCLLALGTGLVERAYWWQLVARGYGLLDPAAAGSLRRRPAFRAMAQMLRALAGGTFDGPLENGPEAYLYRYTDRDGAELIVGWTNGEPVERALPRAAEGAFDRDGAPVALRSSERVELASAPRYFYLVSA
jgi:tRNA A-37 threonylcarbamoyl transferase component Bud32